MRFLVMVLRRLTRGHARTEYTVLRSRLSLSFSDLSLSLSLSFVSPHAVSAAPFVHVVVASSMRLESVTQESESLHASERVHAPFSSTFLL